MLKVTITLPKERKLGSDVDEAKQILFAKIASNPYLTLIEDKVNLLSV
jgi:hypothetical protein